MKATSAAVLEPARRQLRLNLSSREQQLIEQAAATCGRSTTEFVVEAARRAAEEALLGRTIVTVSAEIHAQLLARLDQTPPDNPQLRRTLTSPLPWSP